MTQSEDAVLVREIGRLALFGGRFGARLAARRLPVEEHETAIAIAVSADQICHGVREILQSVGKLTDEFASENDRAFASAIVGSGHLNLNPTIVHVNLSNLSDRVTQVSIRGACKRGLGQTTIRETRGRKNNDADLQPVCRTNRSTGARVACFTT
jgi:hypothetical protein